ncbi:hypothetical protein BESB_000130 [Besnoitia besnoiti]|uniref:Pre-mRNA-splicing factor CWC26, related protein n=1 Tax=Besnoitia besnoiti TaxID=94643 RepID=A0A2A9MMK5_BESBE|nr:hypothetical protein BESB_000130 [Besnoitia besnoiti]PFH37671.1 hypothetical protein BESB_000130 [Besnoitia besnoiti]
MHSSVEKPPAAFGLSGSSASNAPSASSSKLGYLQKYMGGSASTQGGGVSAVEDSKKKKKRRKAPGAPSSSGGGVTGGFVLNDALDEIDVRPPTRGKRTATASDFLQAVQFGRVLKPTSGAHGRAYAYQDDEEAAFGSDGSEQADEEIVVVDADGRNVSLNETQAKRVHAIVRDQEAREMGLPAPGARAGGRVEASLSQEARPPHARDEYPATRGECPQEHAKQERSEVDDAWKKTISWGPREDKESQEGDRYAAEPTEAHAAAARGEGAAVDLSVFNAPVPSRHRTSAGANRSPQTALADLEDSPRRRPSRQDSKSVAAARDTEDLSPPRRRPHLAGLAGPSKDPSSAQAREQADLSPPRRRPVHGMKSEPGMPVSQSPSGSKASDMGDLSPPRRRPAHASASHDHPPRPVASPSVSASSSSSASFATAREGLRPRSLERRTDRDLSPPRRRAAESKSNDEERGRRTGRERGRERDEGERDSGEAGADRRSRTEPDERDGQKSTGLLTLEDYRKSGVAIEREESLLTKEQLEREAVRQVVYRDKQGRIITEAEWLELQEGRGKKRKKERSPAPELEWGRGLVQKEAREKKAQEDAKLAQEPLTRYEIDDDFDRNLQDRTRWEDPVNRVPQKASEHATPWIAPEQPKKTKRPKCPHDAPRNRFGILPGYRWDGVVRGNGYEDRRLKAINRKKMEAHLAHMNNVADM